MHIDVILLDESKKTKKDFRKDNKQKLIIRNKNKIKWVPVVLDNSQCQSSSSHYPFSVHQDVLHAEQSRLMLSNHSPININRKCHRQNYAKQMALM